MIIVKSSIYSKESLLTKNGFTKCCNNSKFNSIGNLYKLNPKLGKGYYWFYMHENLFSISIHEFYFHEDYYLESSLLQYFSLSYFESVSGEELDPYHRLKAGCVKSYWCDNKKYRAIFHKNIPIKSIGIEFTPEYCTDFLSKKYSKEYENPKMALISIDETESFPEMVLLLYQLYNYKGSGICAKLFYEGKVCEAMSLIYERYKHKKNLESINISDEDLKSLDTLALYINNHYSFNLTLDQLSKIACMGLTKLKKTFKAVYKCTIIQYIQHKRMESAEHLLINTDLTIEQIANIVGYKSASRFSNLFKKDTGILPSTYRKFTKKSDFNI